MRPTRASIALAAVAVLIAPFVRDQLRVLVLAALFATAIFAATFTASPFGDPNLVVGARSSGGVGLLVGVAIALDVILIDHSYEWYIGTHFWHRAFTYGLWAFGAFAIGVGVLPVVLALAWLLGGHAETREDRALLAALAATTLWFGLYTAVKASFISSTLAIRVEERTRPI